MADRKTISVDDDPVGKVKLPPRHKPAEAPTPPTDAAPQPTTDNPTAAPDQPAGDRKNDRSNDLSEKRSELRSDAVGDGAPGVLSAEARKARVRGLKAHPRDERSKVQAEVPTFLADAVRDVMDGTLLKNGVVMSRVMEAGLRVLYPDQVADAYTDRCRAVGVPVDWVDGQQWREMLT